MDALNILFAVNLKKKGSQHCRRTISSLSKKYGSHVPPVVSNGVQNF